jgi:hypothetical protein
MMLIMSISLIGIYTLVNSGQKLAKNSDDRLVATNLAKEWLESIGALRDSFLLRAYSVDDCFFTIDISNGDSDKCPAEGEQYFLQDNKTLSSTGTAAVCIGTNGWYSHQFAKEWIACADAPKCGWIVQKECQTPFSRTITFMECGWGMNECIQAQVAISWWADEKLSLEQIFTRH